MGFLKIVAVIVLALLLVIVFFFFWAKSSNLDKKSYNTLYQTSKAADISVGSSLIDIVSYNIGYLSGMTNNTPQRPSQEFYAKNEARVLSALEKLNADIIGFQEIDFGSNRSYNTNQAKMICDSLYGFGAFAVNWDKRYVPFPFGAPNVHFGKVVSGQAVISRFPLLDQHVMELEKVKNNPFYYNALYLNRLVQVVTVHYPLKTFRVMNVHTEAFDTLTRRHQLKYLYNLFKEMNKTQPVILIGDLNSDPAHADEGIHLFLNDKQLGIAAIDRNNPAASVKTYTSVLPNERLDYIIVDTTCFEIMDSRVVCEFNDISDHLPIWAKLRIK